MAPPSGVRSGSNTIQVKLKGLSILPMVAASSQSPELMAVHFAYAVSRKIPFFEPLFLSVVLSDNGLPWVVYDCPVGVTPEGAEALSALVRRKPTSILSMMLAVTPKRRR